jgi:cytidylate kinase
MARKHRDFVIAIDGPAGSGKSTVSKLVAKALNIVYIDTGAMYRALTLKAMRQKLDLADEIALTKLAKSTAIDLCEVAGSSQVILDGEDVAGFIRTPELTNNVRYIARVPGVREEMVKLQRSIGERHGAALEGRDIGTVVFPDADYKFYLDADPDERAGRRYKELIVAGKAVDIDQIKKDVVARDASDMNRSVGALKKASDAILIDTTKLSIDEVVAKILSYIKR